MDLAEGISAGDGVPLVVELRHGDLPAVIGVNGAGLRGVEVTKDEVLLRPVD